MSNYSDESILKGSGDIKESGAMKVLLSKYKNMPVQVKASFWFLICAFLQKGISVLTTPVFTRLLSTAEYGQYNVFNSWLGIITIFVSLNLGAGVYLQGLVKFEEERERYASSLQGLTTTLVIAWVVIYVVFHSFWNDLFGLTTVQMLSMLVMIWASAVFNFWACEQRNLYKYKALVVLTLLVAVAQAATGIIIVIYAKEKVTARILGIAIVELIGYSALYVIQMMRGKKFFYAKFWKHAIRFNIPLIPHYLSQTVLNSADRIMISNMVGDNEAGIYSLAYSVSSIMVIFNSALMQTLNPWIYQKIKAKKFQDIEKVAYISLIIVAVSNLVLILFAPEVIAFFAPRAYYNAVWVVPPIAMSVYFMYSYDLFAKFTFYYEKTNLIMLTSVIGAVLNVLLNHIFINIFGYMAAGYTTLACYMIYSIGHYILMNHICDRYCEGVRPYNVKRFAVITISFLISGFLLMTAYNCFVVRYGVIVIIVILMIIKRNILIDLLRKGKTICG